MKKVFSFLGNWFINMGADALLEQGATLIDEALEQFYKNDPVACTALVKSLHAFVPFLKGLTAKTKTPLDDKAVEEIKQELEQFAIDHEISL